jgi:hypothetical protein
MTEETCSLCLADKEFDPGPVHSETIYEGMTELDKEAEKLGRNIKGFKFRDARRQGAKGRRSGKNGAE